MPDHSPSEDFFLIRDLKLPVYQALKPEETPGDFQTNDLCSVPCTRPCARHVVSLSAQHTAASSGCFCSDSPLGVDYVPSLVQSLRTYCALAEGHCIHIGYTMQF